MGRGNDQGNSNHHLRKLAIYMVQLFLLEKLHVTGTK